MLNFTMKQVDTMWTLGAIACRPCFFDMHKNNNAVLLGYKMNVQDCLISK